MIIRAIGLVSAILGLLAAVAAQLLAARGVQVRIAPETGVGSRSGARSGDAAGPLRADWDAVGE